LIGNKLLLESIAAPKQTKNTGSRVSSMDPRGFYVSSVGFFVEAVPAAKVSMAKAKGTTMGVAMDYAALG